MARRRLDPFAIARALLRPHLYVGLLDAAATTGYMPHLDRFGRVDANRPPTPLDSDQRLAALRYLADKSLASPKAEEATPTISLDTALQDLRALTAADLRALSADEASDAQELVVLEDDANPLVPPPTGREGGSR